MTFHHFYYTRFLSVQVALFLILSTQVKIDAQIQLTETECYDEVRLIKFGTTLTDQVSGVPVFYPWRVIIGQDITYAAKGKGEEWNWSLGNDDCDHSDAFWNLESSPAGIGFARKSTSSRKAVIPSHAPTQDPSIILENGHFGSTHGLLRVAADASHACADNPVEVYFLKDEVALGQSLPNWAIYWEQSPIIQELLVSVEGLHLYDMSTCTYSDNPVAPPKLILDYDFQGYPYNPDSESANTYGICQFQIGSFNTGNRFCTTTSEPTGHVLLDYGEKGLNISIGEACGFSKLLYDKHGQILRSDEGIHVLYRTVAHEVEHAKIECRVWNYVDRDLHPNVGPFYREEYDVDRDGYKDIWEKSREGRDAGFLVPDRSDKYKTNYTWKDPGGNFDPDRCYLSRTPGFDGDCSAGTRYEEFKCRDVEASLDLKTIDQYDWSYDPSDLIQGKNWMK